MILIHVGDAQNESIKFYFVFQFTIHLRLFYRRKEETTVLRARRAMSGIPDILVYWKVTHHLPTSATMTFMGFR